MDISAKHVSDHIISWGRIATETANEALRRRSIQYLGIDGRLRIDLDTSRFTITGTGCGSSAADAFHERDQHPLWRQGYDHDIRSGDVNNNDNDKIGIVFERYMTFQSVIANVVEQVAALGFLKQQN